MKVLFVGSTRRTALALHYFTNLVRLGYLVLPYDPDYFYARHLLERLSVKIRKAPTPSKTKEVSQALIQLCRRNHFDAVLVMAENFLHADTIEEMRKVSKLPPLVIYHSHDNNFVPGILKAKDFHHTLRAYDFVFTTKSQNVSRYRALGQEHSFFIPSAYEPSIHHPIADEFSHYTNRPIDVGFIGTYDHSRTALLETVGWNQVNVWGDHWRRYSQYYKYRDRIHPRAIYDFEFADVTSHTKCSLGLLREEAEDLHTTRTFEIPACGSLQFAPRNEEILNYFEENKEIVCFQSPEELRDKLIYYLKHDWQRAQIAQKGYERCLREKHTYLDRVRTIFQIVNETVGIARTRAMP